MSPPRLADFSLVPPPPGFIDDPYPWYAALREHDPRHRLGPDALLLTRYDDVLAVYRSAHASSDKRREFGPRFGDSPLFEHHTTSLVFNDPPLHTRVRRILMGALNQRAIARMEAAEVSPSTTIVSQPSSPDSLVPASRMIRPTESDFRSWSTVRRVSSFPLYGTQAVSIAFMASPG